MGDVKTSHTPLPIYSSLMINCDLRSTAHVRFPNRGYVCSRILNLVLCAVFLKLTFSIPAVVQIKRKISYEQSSSPVHNFLFNLLYVFLANLNVACFRRLLCCAQKAGILTLAGSRNRRFVSSIDLPQYTKARAILNFQCAPNT